MNMKKIAIITGASSGMGRQFAIKIDRMLKSIDEIWLIARRMELLEEVRGEINRPCRLICEDVTDESYKYVLAKILRQENVEIKMLVNCAGYGIIGEADSEAIEVEVGMAETNCSGLTVTTLVAIPYMSSNSRIINIASSAAFLPQPYFAIYAASKSYVLSFSRALRRELYDRGIVVTAVCPGPVDTEFFSIAEKGSKRAWFKDLTMATADEVVEQALTDSINKKEISVYGVTMKMFRIFTKLVPHKLILDSYGKFYKKNHNEMPREN